MWPMRKAPSLLKLCVQMAIDNLRYIGDVGQTDSLLLEEILPHCTVDQLTHIENSTQERDLSSVTDRLWKRFYEKQFGEESMNVVIKRMKQKQVVFNWRHLYEAKTKEREAAQKKSVDRLKQLYAEAENKKQSRQIQITSKIPPSSNKRSSWGGSSYNVSNVKGNLMKKAKLEYLQSHEAKIHATMRKNAMQRRNFSPQSFSHPTKSVTSVGSSSTSTCRPINTLPRR